MDAQSSAAELAHDIAEDLKSLPPDADDRALEEKLLGYLNRHTRIVRLDLYVYREANTPSSRIVAPRGDRPEITRFAPFVRQPTRLHPPDQRRRVAGGADRAGRRSAGSLEGDARHALDAGAGRVDAEDRGADLDHLRGRVRHRPHAGLGAHHAAGDRQAAGGAGGGDARRRKGRSLAPHSRRDAGRSGTLVGRIQPDARTALQGRCADPRLQSAPRRRDRKGDPRSVREERGAGAAQPAAQRHAARQRLEGPPGDAGAAGRAAGARDRHAAVVGVGAHPAGAPAARSADGAARTARRLGARDRADQQDRARLPRLDAPARARAQPDRDPQAAGGGGRAGPGRGARQAGGRHLEGRRRRSASW